MNLIELLLKNKIKPKSFKCFFEFHTKDNEGMTVIVQQFADCKY